MTSHDRQSEIEARLREAMAGHAASVPEPVARWSDVENGAIRARRSVRTRRGAVGVFSLVAAIAIVVASAMALSGAPTKQVVTTPASVPVRPEAPTSEAPTSGAPTSVSTTAAPISTAPPISGLTSTPPSTAGGPSQAGSLCYNPISGQFEPCPVPGLPPGDQPVWPFLSVSDVQVWQASYLAGGHQPWHLDAAQTASNFTVGYLGFTAINLIVMQTVTANEAHVAVGYATSPGHTATAAVIHLVRFGSGADAPWEVVGTDDTGGLTLTSPRYGSSVTSPVAVGGKITGVDESIRIEVRQVSANRIVGQACCHPAGGTATPWTMTVAYSGATDPVLTIVATTGGHLLGVERFAITAVRV